MIDKELQIRLQFLDEAQEYLETLDQALLGIAERRIDTADLNAALRAAHSIKGGASMMGFEVLSALAHRIEDSFKVLKIQGQSMTLDGELEQLLLASVDCLRRVITGDRQQLETGREGPPDYQDWLEIQGQSIFEQLHDRLGDPQEEDANSVLGPEEGQDILAMLFETEVEGCLQRLEAVMADPEQPCLREELEILAQEMGGLGEMLQLQAFSQLCAAVSQQLQATPDQLEITAQAALRAWRRSQALVLTGQLSLLPTCLDLEETVAVPVPSPDAESPLEEFPLEESVADWIELAPLSDTEVDANRLVEGAVEAVEHSAPTPAFFAVEESEAQSATTWVDADPLETSPATTYRLAEVQPDLGADGEPELSNATVRVPVRQLDQMNDLLGELTIGRNGLDLRLKRLHRLVGLLKQRVERLERSNDDLRSSYDRVATPFGPRAMLPPAVENTTAIASNAVPEAQNRLASLASTDSLPNADVNSQFDVLELDRYSDVHQLSQAVMETIVQIQEVTEDVELSLEDTDQTARSLSKTSRQLKTNLNQLRMRPLSDLLNRLPRALRELCLQHGKEARLVTQGENTLVDRNVLEALSDPLMHLMRNAFDHGIERPELREKRGKPRQGTIEIQASQRSNRTVITIRDDGQGIPIDKIRARAEQMGLDAALIAAASDEELLSLIFEPGFSTKDQITTLSGRGVGMDVVRDRIKQVRGEITVDTEAGQGTTFTLSIPFTLSVVRVLLVESSGMLMAFPTDMVEEMLPFESGQVLSTAGAEILQYEEQMVPLMRLSRWLTFHRPRPSREFETPPMINQPTLLLLNQGNQLAGLQVDRCWGEQEATVRRVEGSLPMPAGFHNCIILGDGQVVPLVNVPELLHWIVSCERNPGRSQPPVTALPSLPPNPLNAPPPFLSNSEGVILVVDDSINVRRFLALTLEKAGYQVEQSKDGQEALEKLQLGLQVQAVICDIEMPRLDGYGFLARVKADPGLSQLPIAMLTSRSGDKHRQLALSLGATAYLTKPYNEQVLLRTLRQMIQTTSVA